jgi:two-component system, response regulator YesN
MYTLILADDEDEVREGIIGKIDWASCGYRLLGAYDNGRDAADAMDAARPDVVITDICMPFMDGLELTQYIAERYRDTKVVIITGYEEFEYAKQAIKLRVSEYLMKPINAKEFTAFLGRLKLELDEEQVSRENMSLIRQQLNQSLPLLRERFLERLSTSIMKKDEIDRKLQYFQISLPGPCYVSLVADLDTTIDSTADLELLQFAVLNIFQDIFEKERGGVVFRTKDDKTAVILSGNFEWLGQAAQTLAAQAAHSVQRFLKLTVTIGIGRTYAALPQLPKSFQEANSALDYRFMLGDNRVIWIGDMERGVYTDAVGYAEWEKKLLTEMKAGKMNKVSAVLHAWLEEWKSAGLTIGQCNGMLHKLLAALMNRVAEAGYSETNVIGEDPFRELAAFRTLDQVKLWLEEICHRIVCFLAVSRNRENLTQMQLAEAYIQENYMDEELSLQQTSSYVYMSPTYFSALFKQHTGYTFIEYLTRLRIIKAKELLVTTGLKAYDIASRVGYGDPQYFSVIFKRHTGKTPKEYRNLSQAGDVS